MDLNALDNALVITNGSLTVTGSTLPNWPMQELLMIYNSGAALTIQNASKQLTADSVVVTGQASFMNVPDLAVQATFTLDSAGNPVGSFVFFLIGADPGANPWTFSNSFPDLPDFSNYSESSYSPNYNVLNSLILTNASFILNTAPGTDSIVNVPLAYGLNFVANVNPYNLLGVLAPLLGSDTTVLYGTITLPQPADRTPMLPVLKNPWNDLGWTVPGILLQASLELDFTLDKLSVESTFLRIYCPADDDWLADNRSYRPDLALTCLVSVPSADIQLDLTAFLNKGEVSFSGLFSGIQLEELDVLQDFVQGSDLYSQLPAEVRSALNELSGFSLTGAGLTLRGGASIAAVSAVYVIVGFPNISWTVIPGLAVTSVSAQFTVLEPFHEGNRSVGVTLLGTIDFGAVFNFYTMYPNFMVQADLEHDAVLSLSSLFEQALPELPAPPDLMIAEMRIFADPGQSYSFSASMMDEPGWTFDLGPIGLAICDVELEMDKQTGKSTTGKFSGQLQLDTDLFVDAEYEVPGSFYIRAQLPDLKLTQLIALFDQIGIELPTGFDLELQQSYIILSQEIGGITFTAATYVSIIGLLAFTAQKENNMTGVAVGINLDVAQLGSVTGLEALEALDRVIGLEKVMLVVSSLAQTGFQFPDMAHFQAPPLAGKNVQLPAQASGLVKGLNFYAQLSTTNSEAFQALASFLDIPLDGTIGVTVGVSLPDPSLNSKLFLSVANQINPASTLTGELGMLLLLGQPGAFLTGRVVAQVQGQPVGFDVTAIVLAAGVMISGTMKGTIDFDVVPVQLSNLAFVIGLDWLGIPSMGIAATLDVSDFNSSIAIFFDSTNPAQSMFAGAVSDLSLRDVAVTLAGQLTLPAELMQVLASIGLKSLHAFNMPASCAGDLDGRDLTAVAKDFQQYGSVYIPSDSSSILLTIHTSGKMWSLTDMSTMTHYQLTLQDSYITVGFQPQIYFAPTHTRIGSILFPAGFHVEACIDFLMIQTQLKVTIQTGQGIAADATIDPITVYSNTFFSMTSADGESGPTFSLSTYYQPTQPKELQNPHLLLSGSICLLGQTIVQTYLSIGESGLAVDINARVSPVLQLHVQGAVNSLTDLYISGGIIVGINEKLDMGALGSIHFVADVNGQLSVSYQSGTASAWVQCGFEFNHVQCSIPSIALDVNGPALTSIAATLWDQIKDVITKLLVDPDQWLSAVYSGAIQLADQSAHLIGQILHDCYSYLSADDIASKTTQYMKYGIDEVTEALEGAGATADEAVQALASLGQYAGTEITNAIGSVYTNVHTDTSFGHIDEVSPHTDIPKIHTDVPRIHTDTKQHYDMGGNHTDSKWPFHIDDKIPHTDTKSHLDETVTPHADTATPHVDEAPHADTGTHIDVNG